MNENLVVYFSRDGENIVSFEKKVLDIGNTKKLGLKIAKELGCEAFELIPNEKYPVSYDETNKRSLDELENGKPVGCKFDIDESVFSGYKNVFLGFPIWHRTCPRIIVEFIKAHKWTGKKVYLFCTNEEGRFGVADNEIRSLIALRGGTYRNGLSVLGSDVDGSDLSVAQFCRLVKE